MLATIAFLPTYPKPDTAILDLHRLTTARHLSFYQPKP